MSACCGFCEDNKDDKPKENPSSEIEEPELFTKYRDGWKTVRRYLNTKLFYDNFDCLVQNNPADQNRTLLHYICSEPADKDRVATNAVIDVIELTETIDPEIWQQFVDSQTSDNGYTALHYAAKNKHKRIVEILLLNGADVNIKAKDEKTDVLGLIYDRLHVVMPRIFGKEEYYKIEEDEYDKSNELLWRVNCNFVPVVGRPTSSTIVNPEKRRPCFNELFRETKVLAEVLRHDNIKQAPILLHPLVQIFLYRKGAKLKWLIGFSMLYHITWSVLVSIFFSCNFNELEFNSTTPNGTMQNCNATENITKNATVNITESSQKSSSDNSSCSGGPYFGYKDDHLFCTVYFWAVLSVWFITLVKEAIEAVVVSPSFKFYIKQYENRGQILVLLIFPISFVLTPYAQSLGNKSQTAENIRICLFILNTVGIGVSLLLIQAQFTKTDSFGIYNQMLLMIIKKFVSFFVAFLPKLIAFLVLFNRVMPHMTHVWSLGVRLGLNKILSMMIGELTYDEPFKDNPYKLYSQWITASIVFFVFAVTVTILLQNLLLGLIIDDMEELRAKALVDHLAARLEVMYMIEKFLTCNCLINCLERCGYKHFLNLLLVGKQINIQSYPEKNSKNQKNAQSDPKEAIPLQAVVSTNNPNAGVTESPKEVKTDIQQDKVKITKKSYSMQDLPPELQRFIIRYSEDQRLITQLADVDSERLLSSYWCKYWRKKYAKMRMKCKGEKAT